MAIWIKRHFTRKSERERFQRLTREHYRIVSPPYWLFWWRLRKYNCIAFSAGDTTRWWWPDPYDQYYWPPGVTREVTVPAFIEMFCSLGYKDFMEGEPNPPSEFENVALYYDPWGRQPFTFAGMPSHATRQMENGNWRSKLGATELIEHTMLDCMAGRFPSYGEPIKQLRKTRIRKRSFWQRLRSFTGI